MMGDFNAISLWDFATREGAAEELSHYPQGVNVLNSDNGGPKVVAQMEKTGYVDAYARFGEAGQTHPCASIIPPFALIISSSASP